LCDTEKQAPTPVGKLCLECDEPIEEDQQGIFYLANAAIDQCRDERYLVWVEGDLFGDSLASDEEVGHGQVGVNGVHKECGFRAVQGGIGHYEDHTKWCIGQHDPDGGRTRRQSSLEVWDRFTRIAHFQEN
jgi:hypothetical protein